MDDTMKSCREFVTVLASSAPAPGGGGAAALAAALGTALGNMVAALTVGKKNYADVEEELRGLMARCEQLQAELLDQVAADKEGFLPLARAYGMPKDDPARAEVLEAATLTACAAPVRIMELCGQSLDIIKVMAEKGSRLAVSDAGCGAALLKAGLDAAALNVYINTRSLQDRAEADRLNAACRQMQQRYGALAEKIYNDVEAALLR